MAPTRLLLSLARSQGLGRVRETRPIFVSSFFSWANQGALRKHHECSSAGSNGCSKSEGLLSSFYLRHIPHRLPSRSFASAPLKQEEINEIIDDINSKFADAREEIELASESKETVYFNEEAETAKKAVNEVLGMFNSLLARLPESERGALQRSMGMKMEQLKAEVAQLDEH
ncbi:embryogenesis-like protein [Physcomitrium patens]|uniref:Uncharacterized protein n=1 Tax=Physcomitrium patens TaxID=3218 RepID=A0A2K1J4T3_PHYPA|nr:uncharacterized protein LOC112294372 [Physcomitrium patens]PNR36535.1 hypothetical protein PHYPA_022386 [Physcomitrium patens]|eukprot:XP_024400474.1 uncharacterized protein LOC112294372 [Physcomitrella patens]